MKGQPRLHVSPFRVIDTSLKEAASEATWEEKARLAIRRSDLVMVMVGRHTHLALGVLMEPQLDREAGKLIVQAIG